MSTKLVAFIVLLSRFLGSVSALNIKLLSTNVLKFVGDSADPHSAQKMRKISKAWSNVKFYENILESDYMMAVYRNVNTNEIIWEASTVKDLVYNEIQGEINLDLGLDQLLNTLLSLLRRNDGTKWNDVLRWFDGYWWLLKNNAKNEPLLQKLISAVAENADVALVLNPLVYGGIESFPLCIASSFGNTDSMLKLIEGGANVDGRCHLIGAATPLIATAYRRHESAMRLLLEKGANRNLTDNYGKTALQHVQDQVSNFWLEYMSHERRVRHQNEVRRLVEILQQ